MAKGNFDDFRNTLLSTINFVTEKVLDLADAAADTAKTGHEIAKLLMEKKKAEAVLTESYQALGKRYYELNKSSAGSVYEDLCDDIADALETLENIDEEIAELKESMGSEFEDIEVEFDEFFDDADFERVVNDAETQADTADASPAPDASAGIADARDDQE